LAALRGCIIYGSRFRDLMAGLRVDIVDGIDLIRNIFSRR
jgi:hypothetical protein